MFYTYCRPGRADRQPGGGGGRARPVRQHPNGARATGGTAIALVPRWVGFARRRTRQAGNGRPGALSESPP